MPKQNKYLYVYIVQGDYGYGHGWEDLTEHDTRRAANDERRVYDKNEAAPHRVISRRVANPDYTEAAPCTAQE